MIKRWKKTRLIFSGTLWLWYIHDDFELGAVQVDGIYSQQHILTHKLSSAHAHSVHSVLLFFPNMAAAAAVCHADSTRNFAKQLVVICLLPIF